MNKQQLKNLKKLPKVLREEAARRDALGDKRKAGDAFDMESYGNVVCGTPACVLGTYAYRKDVQSEFCLRRDRVYGGIGVFVKGTSEEASYDSDIVQEHFGLDYKETEELFGADGCDSAQSEEEAARFIEQFIADKEAYL